MTNVKSQLKTLNFFKSKLKIMVEMDLCPTVSCTAIKGSFHQVAGFMKNIVYGEMIRFKNQK